MKINKEEQSGLFFPQTGEIQSPDSFWGRVKPCDMPPRCAHGTVASGAICRHVSRCKHSDSWEARHLRKWIRRGESEVCHWGGHTHCPEAYGGDLRSTSPRTTNSRGCSAVVKSICTDLIDRSWVSILLIKKKIQLQIQ